MNCATQGAKNNLSIKRRRQRGRASVLLLQPACAACGARWPRVRSARRRSVSAAAARFAVFRRNTTLLQSKTVYLLVAPPTSSLTDPGDALPDIDLESVSNPVPFRMLSSDESRVHRRTLLQVQERLLAKQSQELIDGSALESLRDSALSSASTNRSSGQSEMLRPNSEPKPLSNSDLASVFRVPSRTNSLSFGSASKSRQSQDSELPYVPRDHTVPEAVIAGQIPSLLFRPIDADAGNISSSRTGDGSSSPGPAALSGAYSQDKRFPPLLDGSDSSQLGSPRGENPVRPKSLSSPRGVTIVPYSLPASQGNVAVDVVWRRSRSFTDLSSAEERTPLKSKSASSTYDAVAASDSSHMQINKYDQSPVVKVAIVAILTAALVGVGYFATRYFLVTHHR